MRILIIGAGISGLAMAIALEKQGIYARIIEKSSALRCEGLGIALPMNAVACLDYFGLVQELIKLSYVAKNITYSLSSGEILSKKSLLEYPLNDYPFVALQRKQLLSLLATTINSRIEYNRYLTDIRFEKAVPNLAMVKFNDGEIAKFDLVIGADGIHSGLRKRLFRKELKEDIGIRAWRFLANFSQEDPIYYIGKKSVFMIYPISKTQTYCYAHIPEISFPTLIHKKELNIHFKEYPENVTKLINSVSKMDVISDKLFSVSKPVLKHLNVAFIGDAAHACSPMLQQGAASAFEDAITLAKMLHQFTNIAEALTHYTNIRLPRVRWVKDNSDIPLKKNTSCADEKEYEKRNEIIREMGPINITKWKSLFSVNYFEMIDNYLNSIS